MSDYEYDFTTKEGLLVYRNDVFEVCAEEMDRLANAAKTDDYYCYKRAAAAIRELKESDFRAAKAR